MNKAFKQKESQTTDPQYGVIPNSILKDRKISDGSKLLYSVILVLSENGNKGCSAATSYLSECTAKAPVTIEKYLAELEDAGYITRESYYSSDTNGGERRIIHPKVTVKIKTTVAVRVIKDLDF